MDLFTPPKICGLFSGEPQILTYNLSLLPGLVILMFVLAEKGLSLVLLALIGLDQCDVVILADPMLLAMQSHQYGSQGCCYPGWYGVVLGWSSSMGL